MRLREAAHIILTGSSRSSTVERPRRQAACRVRRSRHLVFALTIFSIATGAPALAGPANVVDVRASCGPRGGCTFDVTVMHTDEGWDHYADRWESVGPDGEVLATRVLQHPHVSEQPFTRRLAHVKIPATVTEVVIRARDSRHGFGGAELTVAIER